jgi:LAO/AO transport system kinase
MWERIEAGLRQEFRERPEVRGLLPEVARAVADGRLAASTAARRLLQAGGRQAFKDSGPVPG